jgi:hypothetical protein
MACCNRRSSEQLPQGRGATRPSCKRAESSGRASAYHLSSTADGARTRCHISCTHVRTASAVCRAMRRAGCRKRDEMRRFSEHGAGQRLVGRAGHRAGPPAMRAVGQIWQRPWRREEKCPRPVYWVLPPSVLPGEQARLQRVRALAPLTAFACVPSAASNGVPSSPSYPVFGNGWCLALAQIAQIRDHGTFGRVDATGTALAEKRDDPHCVSQQERALIRGTTSCTATYVACSGTKGSGFIRTICEPLARRPLSVSST